MRFVIDNNEVTNILKTTQLTRAQKERLTVVLPPLVWAEAVLGPHRARLYGLLDYGIRFGIDVAQVLRNAATATDAQLRNVDSLVRKGSLTHRRCLYELKTCPPERLLRAREIKDGNLADMDRNYRLFQAACRQARDARSRGGEPGLLKDLPSLDAAIAALGDRLNIPFHAPDDDPAPARTFRELLTSGNVRLENFVRFDMCLNFARTGSWKDKNLNVAGPSGKRDDVPDMTLPLYADAGDIIVTGEKEKKFGRLFRMGDPMKQVRVMLWHDCVTMIRKGLRAT
jgi:hypothetical protein